MTTIINASPSNGLVQTADGSGVLKVQSNGVTTNALAWVNFNGTTSPGTIRAQYNVSSVTRNATGNYTINFTSALADANYSVVGTGMRNIAYGTTQNTINVGIRDSTTYSDSVTTSAVSIVTRLPTSAAEDNPLAVCVSIHGN